MKKQLFIYFIFALLLNCKSTKTETKIVNSIAIKNAIWQQVGPDVSYKDVLNKYSEFTKTYWFGNGRISAIKIDEHDDNHILIGVSFGGLFETFDAGKTWHSLTDKIAANEVQKIETKNNTIFIATGYQYKNPIRFSAVKREFYGLGVVKSTDQGKTWHLPKVTFNCTDFSLSQQHNTIYAVSWNKVYKSIDNGDSFVEISDFSHKGLTNINDSVMYNSVVVHPTNPNIAYVSGRGASAKNANIIYKTVDGGKTWANELANLEKHITSIPKKATAHFIKDVALFYNEKSNNFWIHFSVAFQFETTSKRKYKKVHSYILNSTDFTDFKLNYHQEIIGGTHFSPKFYEKDNTFYLMAWFLQIKEPNDEKFTNVGKQKVHQDTRAVGIDSKGIIYYGNDAGIVKSLDKGKTWLNAYKNLNANLVNEMGYFSNKTERRLAIGTQDTGYYISNLDSLPRYPIGVHEGAIYISPHTKDRIYLKGNKVQVTNDGGKTFKYLYLNNGKRAQVLHKDGMLCEDPVNPNILYVGHINDVYVSDKLGEKGSWTKISPKNKDFGRSADLAIPKSNTNILYLANRLVTFPVKKGSYGTFKTQGHLMKSTDKGKTWTKISNQFKELLTNAVISDVEVDDDNPNKIWFTLRNAKEGQKIYHSKNGGKTWINISYNLPNVPANRVEYNQKTKQLILANDYGVYYLENNIWKTYGKGLPKVIITSLVLDHNFNEILVSTFGRGVWRVPLK